MILPIEKAYYPNPNFLEKNHCFPGWNEKDKMTDDGIEMLNYQTFLSQLWRGNIFL